MICENFSLEKLEWLKISLSVKQNTSKCQLVKNIQLQSKYIHTCAKS